MAMDGLHLNRARARVFGSVAREYDRYRAAYPDALLDYLVAMAPARVLDVACGTGKIAVALAERGLSVLGVELDGRMAEVARRQGVTVEVAPFESWDDAGRRFDLITCGDAWHWINPEVGVAVAARLLLPGGTTARFWNYHELHPSHLAAFEAVYQKYAPQSHRVGGGFDGGLSADPFESCAAFYAVEARTYRWERTLSADEWVGLVATYADHQELGPERLAAFQRALRVTIEEIGGTVRSAGGTHVLLARRA